MALTRFKSRDLSTHRTHDQAKLAKSIDEGIAGAVEDLINSRYLKCIEVTYCKSVMKRGGQASWAKKDLVLILSSYWLGCFRDAEEQCVASNR